ncbi:hypothetical protein [Pseudoalteromonas rubra]|uniref:hypothetical protein n=1 Tax=Pseudoalteromonas rubra TaxID=43658 RepID=UPI00026CBDF2|nr:hypothetical protein [Pseudoalteromonas rubra]
MEASSFFLCLLVVNTVFSIVHRWRLSAFSRAKLKDVPEPLLQETQAQIKDGYRITKVSQQSVTLVKTKTYLLTWFLVLPNVAFNTAFLCNVYGIILTNNNGVVDIKTF